MLEWGLTSVRIISADRHAGLAAAARQAQPEAQLQRCTVHLARDVLAKAPSGGCVDSSASRGRPSSRRRLSRPPGGGRRGWGVRCPRGDAAPAAGLRHRHLLLLLPHGHAAPAQHQRPGAPPRRGEAQHPWCRGFPDRDSALRLFTAVALEVTGVWDDRRYLNVALLKSTQTPLHHAAKEPSSPNPPPGQLHKNRDLTV
ncbi:hypothetical protein HNV27_15285 [Myxococcus xanthus]|nr:hypothetical protein [Myxococcus xanthus]